MLHFKFVAVSLYFLEFVNLFSIIKFIANSVVDRIRGVNQRLKSTSTETIGNAVEQVFHHSQGLSGREDTTLTKLDRVETEIVGLEILIERSVKHLELRKNIKVYLEPTEASDITRLEGDGIDDSMKEHSSKVTWADVTVYGDRSELYPGVNFYTTQEVGKLTGMSQRTILAWINKGKLLGFQRQGVQGYRLPSIQFKDGKPLQGLEEVISTIGDPYATWHFLRVPQYLDVKAVLPIDVPISGDDQLIRAVILVAGGYGSDFS